MIHSSGERIGDFEAIQYQRKSRWIWRCVHCKKEKTTTFSMMKRTGMKHCSCQTSITKQNHRPGEIVGDFRAMRHKRSGQWLFRCIHCRAEKTASFGTMEKTGMKHCACRKPLLTPAQQRVAALFAQGYRTCDIAKALEIDPCTVSLHLRNIYEKRQDAIRQ